MFNLYEGIFLTYHKKSLNELPGALHSLYHTEMPKRFQDHFFSLRLQFWNIMSFRALITLIFGLREPVAFFCL